MFVHVGVGFFIQAKWQQHPWFTTLKFLQKPWANTADSAFSCTRQDYNWSSFSVYFLFGFTAFLLSAISCFHIYASLTLGKLSMILLPRNVILCLLYPKCWRLLGTNVLLMYSSSGISVCFLVLCLALTVKRSSPAGKVPVLVGKDKIFCSYSSWILCVWVAVAAPADDVCRNKEEVAPQTGALGTEAWAFLIAFVNVIEVHWHPSGDAGRVRITWQVHCQELTHLALISLPYHWKFHCMTREHHIPVPWDRIWPPHCFVKPRWQSAGHKSSVARHIHKGHK